MKKNFLSLFVCIGMLLGLSPVFIGTTAKATADGIDPSSYTFDAVDVGYSSIAKKEMDVYFSYVTGKTSAELTSEHPEAFILDCVLIPVFDGIASGKKTFSVKPKDGLSAGTYNATVKLTFGDKSYTSDVSFTVNRVSASNLNIKYKPDSNIFFPQTEHLFSENLSLDAAVDGAYFAPNNPDPIQIYATILNGEHPINSSIETVSANNIYKALVFDEDDLNSLNFGYMSSVGNSIGI